MKSFCYLLFAIRIICYPAGRGTLADQLSNFSFSMIRPSGPIQSISCDVHVSVCLSVCLYVPSCEVPFKCLFAPIYKGPKSNILGPLDSLGKSYGKEVVSDFAILARKWSKIAARKKVNFGLFFNYHLTGLHYILQVG